MSETSQPTSGQLNSPQNVDNSLGWERSLLEKLAMEGLNEQRRKRRWGIFFKFLVFAYLTALIVIASDWSSNTRVNVGPHTALVNLQGVIDAEGMSSAEKINSSLQAAFGDVHTAAVVLRINSPGGSPVQAGMIYDEIRRLRKQHPKTPLYVVVEEICASGGYYVAAAADQIFVDKASLVGSIGVLMDGFGFEDVMRKVGVERRLLTAGENKGFLDPFSPTTPKQKQIAQSLLDEIHQQFIAVVREGRGKRLKETPDVFSGLVWSGSKSVAIGLADGLGTVESVARDIVKVPEVLDYTEQESFTERFAKRVGVTFSHGIASTLLSRQVSWR